eukprot:2735319-Amphidinium_carterae.1
MSARFQEPGDRVGGAERNFTPQAKNIHAARFGLDGLVTEWPSRIQRQLVDSREHEVLDSKFETKRDNAYPNSCEEFGVFTTTTTTTTTTHLGPIPHQPWKVSDVEIFGYVWFFSWKDAQSLICLLYTSPSPRDRG